MKKKQQKHLRGLVYFIHYLCLKFNLQNLILQYNKQLYQIMINRKYINKMDDKNKNKLQITIGRL